MSIQQGVYKHYKGGLYTVLMSAISANNKEDLPDMVVYVSHSTGQVYVRSAYEFFGKTTLITEDLPSGLSVNRFEFVASSIGVVR
jgi:hypothetical protein